MRIVTDSGADLFFPRETMERLDITTVPLRVKLGNIVYREGVDIQTGDFYHLLKKTKSLPVTSPPSVADFAETYRKVAETDPNILSIHMSGSLSKTFETAQHAARLVPQANIVHYNTKTLSAVVGWMLEAASRAVKANWKARHILELVKVIGERSHTIYTVDDLKYLINGGRISHLRGLMANILNIKPMIGLNKTDGSFLQLGQERTFKGALKGLIKEISKKHEFGSKLRVQVLHSFSHEKATEFKYQIDDKFDVKWLPNGEISLVLGAHAGPSMVGVAFADQEIFDQIEKI